MANWCLRDTLLNKRGNSERDRQSGRMGSEQRPLCLFFLPAPSSVRLQTVGQFDGLVGLIQTSCRYQLAVTQRKEEEPSSTSIYNLNDPWTPTVDFTDFINNETVAGQVSLGEAAGARMSHFTLPRQGPPGSLEPTKKWSFTFSHCSWAGELNPYIPGYCGRQVCL